MPSEPRQRQILPMTQTVQKTTEILQLQFPDHLIDVPLVFVVLVPQMQVVSETVEISRKALRPRRSKRFMVLKPLRF